MDPGPGRDRGAACAIVTGDCDDRPGWLRGGEALSAVLLTATSEGLSVAPISDVIEVATTRETLRRMLCGVSYPYLAVRIGYPVAAADLPIIPRRAPGEVIET